MLTLSSSLSTNRGHRLPPEMIDHVIDYLHDDKPSLRSCSLVAHAFVASSQLHLFRSLSCAWEEASQDSDLGYTYIARFFREHPHLKPYVRGVDIHERWHPTLLSNEVNAICLCVVIDILSMFPRLRAFEIRAINLNFNACCSTPPAQPFSPIDIKYLNLADLTSCNASLQPVIKLLGLFNRIHSLQIVEVWVHGDAREGADELAKSTIDKDLAELPSSWSPSLALLTIAGTPEGMFAPYTHILTTRNMLGDLEELNIQCCNWEDLPCAAAIISSNKGLSELTIDVSTLIKQEVEVDNEEDLLSMTIQPDRWKDFKLSSLHSLRYFETSVKLFIPESKEDFPTVQPSVRGFQYMLDFLSHAPRSIENLTIVLKFEWSDQYRQSLSQDYDWGRLATIIYSFPAIKTANIIVADRSPAFLAVSAQCGRIVMNGFTRSSKIRENNRVIRILCQHADYDNFLLDTDV